MKGLFSERRLELRTPEGIVFSLPLAGPVSRLLALWVDLAVVSVLAGIVRQVVTVLFAWNTDAAQGAMTVAYFLLSFLYGIVSEWLWQGQTVGKRLLGIRVMDRDGLPMQFAQIVVRNLIRPIDMLPAFYLVGGIASLWTRHGQRLGDLAANTVVTRTRSLEVPDLRKLDRGRFNSMLEHPHLAARLRQRVPPPLAGIALDALLRRDQLDDGPRVALFRELADRLRSYVPFPPESVENLSDEQYVRNAVEILYRSSGA